MFIYNCVSDKKRIKQLLNKGNIVKTEGKKKKGGKKLAEGKKKTIAKKLTKKNQIYLKGLGFKIKSEL